MGFKDYKGETECLLIHKVIMTKASQMKSLRNVSRSGEKGGPSAQQMVESRMLYVGTEERMLLYEMFLLYMKKPYAVSISCAPQGAHRPGLLTLSHRHMSL